MRTCLVCGKNLPRGARASTKYCGRGCYATSLRRSTEDARAVERDRVYRQRVKESEAAYRDSLGGTPKCRRCGIYGVYSALLEGLCRWCREECAR